MRRFLSFILLFFAMSLSFTTVARDKTESAIEKINLYNFEFRFLPSLANSLKPSEDAAVFLSDVEYITAVILAEMGYELNIKPAEITPTTIGNGSAAVVVWTMPDPDEIPMAKYIAFVPDKNSESYTVYTLEKSISLDGPEAWVLGIAKPNGHGNLGTVPFPSDPKQFISLIGERAGLTDPESGK